jgi:hypothetical protein
MRADGVCRVGKIITNKKNLNSNSERNCNANFDVRYKKSNNDTKSQLGVP